MIIVDNALKQRAAQGKPVRVGMVGAGYMGRGIAMQILSAMPGMRLVAIANRTVDKAQAVYRGCGVHQVRHVANAAQVDAAIAANEYAITDDPTALCRAAGIEAIIETTCDFESGTQVTLDALTHRKHVVLMNAEVDSTVGCILKVYADRNGVIYTYTDGDEPGVAMNLYRFVESIDCKPVLMGQIKGFLDHYRNPDTQRGFAEMHKQKPAMVASYADGSKLAIESAILGNASGFKPAKRGMYGHRCAHVKDLLQLFKVEDFRDGGLVDYTIGSEPHTGGAFVVGYNDHPVKREYLGYFKLGPGPLYMFYQPFHLPHLQLPHSVARAVLFNDATITPRGAPVCDAITVAKRDLQAGETLDGMGGFTCYGLVESYEVSAARELLPIVLSGGCRLKRGIPKDGEISYHDVVLPQGRLCDRLRREQAEYFAAAAVRVAGA